MTPKASTSSTSINKALRSRKRPKYVTPEDAASGSSALAVQKDKSISVRKRLTRLGKLAGIMSMPMDVLFEIFGHLRPLDVLHLARTTKEFRRVLMHRSALSIWRAAFDNVPGFPRCPPQMTEPQWTNLAFDPHCNICLTSNTRTVEWRLRVRICTKCAKEHLEESRHSWRTIWDDQQHFSYRELVPHRPGKRGNEIIFIDELESVKEQYLAIEGSEARKAFIEERHKLVKEVVKHAILCENWVAAQVQTRAEELTELKESRKQAIIDRLSDLGWGEEIMNIPYHDDLSNHKLVKQPHLLTDRIWKNISAPMIEYMETMRANRLIREHAALVLVRKHAAINVLRAYKMSHLPCVEIMPEPVDFCAFPPIKQVLELPLEVDVTESSFDEVVPLLPDLIDEWRAKIKKLLVRKMMGEQKDALENIMMMGMGMCGISNDEVAPEPEETEEEMAEKMNLAVTVFQCRSCCPARHSWIESDDEFYDINDPFSDFLGIYTQTSKPLFYPKVLGHRCLTKPVGLGWLFGFADGADPSVKLDSMSSERKKWSCEQLRLDKPSGKVVEKIIEACGLDPATTTADDMDELNPRLACLTCARWDEEFGELVQMDAFGWRTAVKHHSEKHYRKVVSWHLLLDDELQQALEAEEFLLAELTEEEFTELPSDVVVWSCLLCRDRPCEQPPMGIDQVKAHIKNKHGISDAELNVDYAKDFAAPQVYHTETLAQYSELLLELEMPE